MLLNSVGAVHRDKNELGFNFSRLIAKGVQDDWLRPHPHKVIPGGLEGIQEALTRLKENRASAVKLCVHDRRYPWNLK